MESTDLDMGEIFDDNDIDEDIGATGVLPDLEPTQSQDNEEDENAEVLARLKDLSKGAAKKVVRKPQPKLDATRLTGERGIPILPKLFKDVKFKGKGHEAHDLAILMRQMEHWSHRLFPKMPFDEVIERVEKLGSKKEVQTCIKKIRIDMPVLAEDFVGSDREDDDVVRRGDSEDDVVRGGDYEPEISARDEMKGEVRAEDMWDELLREEAEITESQVETEPTYTATKTSSHANSVAMDTPATPVQTGGKTNSACMTPEMLERIERNKQLALEKRLKKMGHLTPGSKLASSPLSSQTPTKTNTINNVKSPEAKQTVNHSENVTADSERSSEKEEQDSQVINGKLSTDSAIEMSEVEKCPSQNVRVDGDSEMSEVIEKGTTQNITVDGKPKENAQHWHTGAASHLDTGLQLDSQTESMDTENTDVVVDNCGNSKEMSEIIENQNGDYLQDLSQSSVDSLAMSEVIEPIENEKIVLKEKVNNTANNTSSVGKKIIATNDGIDSKMSNDKIITDGSVGKENNETDTVDMTGDHCKSKELDQFDDELTEDQLMETLEY